MADSAKKLVVCGGNGFLGSRICKYAVERGWDVTSISRSGEPKWATVTSSPSPPTWSHKVTWERADILSPSTYTPLLTSATAVVHTMGILLESDYKGVVRGEESPITAFTRLFSEARAGSQNPMTKKEGEDLKPQEPANASGNKITYELMNRDTAIMLAKEADAKGVKTFAYISAAAGAPVLPARYITTKREAEVAIAENFPGMRSVFMRPGFLYDSSRPITMPLAAGVGMGAVFNSVTGGVFNNLMGAAGTKPLKADLVAEAVVEALEDETVKGPVDTAKIEELATKAWRKGML